MFRWLRIRFLRSHVASGSPSLETIAELGELGGDDAIELLVEVLEADQLDLRQAAGSALRKLRYRPTEPRIRALYAIARGDFRAAARVGRPAVTCIEPRRIVAFSAQSHMFADSFQGMLAAVRDPRAASPLADLLLCRDLHWKLRQAAARGLVAIRGQGVAKRLVDALPTSDSVTLLCDVLGSTRDPSVLPALLEVLGRGDLTERIHACEALESIGDAGAVKALVLELEKKEPSVSPKAADALGAIGGPEAIKALSACLTGDDPLLQRACARALKNNGWKPTTKASAAAYALALGDWRALGETGGAGVRALVQRMETLSQESAGAYRGHGSGASRWVSRDDRNRGSDIYGQVLDLERKLAVVHHPDAKDALIEALAHHLPVVRSGAATALGGLGDGSAVEALLVSLEDSDGRVRQSAARSLRQLKWRPSGPRQQVLVAIAEWKWDVVEKHEPSVAIRQLKDAIGSSDPNSGVAGALTVLEKMVRQHAETLEPELLRQVHGLWGGQRGHHLQEVAEAAKRALNKRGLR